MICKMSLDLRLRLTLRIALYPDMCNHHNLNYYSLNCILLTLKASGNDLFINILIN